MNLQVLKTALITAKAILQNPSTQRRVETAACYAVEAEHKNRIFNEGKASNGSKIGNYSGDPIYVGKEQLTGLPKGKFRPQGKHSKSKKFKNGNSRKTMYHKDGYSQFRRTVGRQNKHVDLNLTGTTMNQLQTGTKSGKVTYGFTAERAVEIMQSNEKRFGKEIVKVNNQEQQIAINAANKEVLAILETIL